MSPEDQIQARYDAADEMVAGLIKELEAAEADCPTYTDFPTAWAIQRLAATGYIKLAHHERCSSVPGWHALSGPGFLCDCGAVAGEADRRRALSSSQGVEVGRMYGREPQAQAEPNPKAKPNV